eukprot:Hpha_TRINITY_DN14925_c0_g2::TRINITY_DN14925_c0_g2_i1::g.144945::m.144945
MTSSISQGIVGTGTGTGALETINSPQSLDFKFDNDTTTITTTTTTPPPSPRRALMSLSDVGQGGCGSSRSFLRSEFKTPPSPLYLPLFDPPPCGEARQETHTQQRLRDCPPPPSQVELEKGNVLLLPLIFAPPSLHQKVE